MPQENEGDAPKRRGRIPQSAWPMILERYRNGATLSAIAREFDCTPSAISYIVRKAEASSGTEDGDATVTTGEDVAVIVEKAAPPAATVEAAPALQAPAPAQTDRPRAERAPGDRQNGGDRHAQGERWRQDRPSRDGQPQGERPERGERPQRARGPESDRQSDRQRPNEPRGERRTLTGAAVAGMAQERSQGSGLSQGQRSYSDRLADRGGLDFNDQDIYTSDVDNPDRFANRPAGSEYPYRQHQRNPARQEALETPTEPADTRMTVAASRAAEAYTAWKTNPGEVGMQSLAEALHDLRKVIARMEIEMSASRKQEHAARPIPIPYHRAQRR